MNLIAIIAALVIMPFNAPHIDFPTLPLEQQMAVIEVVRPDPPERVRVFFPSFSTLPPAPVGEPWFQPLIETYFQPADDEWAARVSLCESGWRPDALNHEGSGAAGLFQFLRSTWEWLAVGELGFPSYDSGAVYDPELNVAAAAALYYRYGSQHWVCQ